MSRPRGIWGRVSRVQEELHRNPRGSTKAGFRAGRIRTRRLAARTFRPERGCISDHRTDLFEMTFIRLLMFVTLIAMVSVDAHARTIWRCQRDGSVSLATAPEPGSQCTAKTLEDNSPLVPNLWGALGVFHGTLYQREQDGKTVYSTRNLPGSTKVQAFTVATPAASPTHVGLGKVGQPQIGVYPHEFGSAAKIAGIDEAWLRAIAHAESNYAPDAVSVKGAKGVMQLMPEVIGDYRVADPFSAKQSILAGAKYLKALETRYEGDRILASAAYNAGPAAVTQYNGVPPYAETQEYIAKVTELYTRYRKAMGLAPRSIEMVPAQ
jgi:Transglycosylase SLT domain